MQFVSSFVIVSNIVFEKEKNLTTKSGCFILCQKKAYIGNLARESRVKLNAFHAEGQF
jgi:hypothetical protein